MNSFAQNKKIYFIIFLVGFNYLTFVLPALAGYSIEVGLPNLPAGTSVSDPAAYIRYFFIFGLGLVGFLAVGAIVVGGIMYMTGGTVGKVERARQIIWGAVTGVILLLCSYLLLYTIDPTLVNLSPFRPPSPGTIPQTQQQIQQQLQQKYAQPNTEECNNTATCTEAKCGPGALSGTGACANGEVWDAAGRLGGRPCSCFRPSTVY